MQPLLWEYRDLLATGGIKSVVYTSNPKRSTEVSFDKMFRLRAYKKLELANECVKCVNEHVNALRD